jgi:hypothetical protein
MIRVRGTRTAVVFLFAGTMLPVYAQHEGQGDKQEKRDEKHSESSKPKGRQNESQPPPHLQAPQAEHQQRPREAQEPEHTRQPGQQPAAGTFSAFALAR